MNDRNNIVIFIVGLGAPASLYVDYLDNLKALLPQKKIIVLEWWSQDDFGMAALGSHISNSSVILIAHSAGGVIALQAFAKWPHLVKKIIMLDSHFKRSKNALPTVSRMLDIMLSKDNSIIKNRVESAYAPLIDNSSAFDKALTFALQWDNDHLDQVCTMLNSLPMHSVLMIAFTNSSYQALSCEDKTELMTVWKKFNVDVQFLAMNHFDLIDANYVKNVNQLILESIDGSPCSLQYQ